MTALAQGILGHRLDWTMISIGLAFGAALIVTDLALRRTTRTLRLPALATGIGLYLPPTVGVTVLIGAVLSFLADRILRSRDGATREAATHRGALLASGLIVGESLVGVLTAGIIAGTGRQDALVIVGPGFAPVAGVLGAVLFVAGAAYVVRTVVRTGVFPRA